MIRKVLDWLGSLKSDNAKLNDEVNADAVRIASLEAANNKMARHLAAARNDLARAMQGNAAWSAKCKDLQDKLDAAQPLIAYAKRRKDSLARYELRRGK